MNLRNFLEGKRVSDILGPSPRAIIGIEECKTIRETFAVLRLYQVSALAVYTHDNNYVAWISRFDLLHYAIESDGFSSKKAHASETYFNTALKEVVRGLDPRPRVHFISEEATLFELLNMFIENGVKRVFARKSSNDDGGVFAVTEIDFLGFIFTSMEEIPGFIDTKCEKLFDYLKEFPGTFETVHADQSALLGFEKMVSHKRNALGVVNAEGSIVAHLSVSDFCGTDQCFSLVHEPVLAFLKGIQKKDSFSQLDTWVVHPQFTLSQLLGKMLYFAIHQLWWLDTETMKPKLLVTSSGLMCFIREISK